MPKLKITKSPPPTEQQLLELIQRDALYARVVARKCCIRLGVTPGPVLKSGVPATKNGFRWAEIRNDLKRITACLQSIKRIHLNSYGSYSEEDDE